MMWTGTRQIMAPSLLGLLLLVSIQPSLSFSPISSVTRPTKQSLASNEPQADSSLEQPVPSTSPSLSPSSPSTENQEEEYTSFFTRLLRRLAAWSLQDYRWRAQVWQEERASRMLQDSLDQLQGTSTYIRPMDAPQAGPLGKFEKESVDWLEQVFVEESQRAESILSNSSLVRPKDIEKKGPLGRLEAQASTLLSQLFRGEQARVTEKWWQPPRAIPAHPLGIWEERTLQVWNELLSSEETRRLLQQNSRDTVRPMDVPGPLGEWEVRVLEIYDQEVERVRQNATRPLPSTVLGRAETNAVEAVQNLTREEWSRLASIQQLLREQRPMEQSKKTWLGYLEAIAVGVVRAPLLLWSVMERVQELSQSSVVLDDENGVSERRNAK